MSSAWKAAAELPGNAPGFELNPQLRVAALTEGFASSGRLQISDFLTSESAHQIRRHLSTSDSWRHVFNVQDQTIELPSVDWDLTENAKRAPILRSIEAVAAYDFQYQYDTIRVPDRAQERRSDSLLDRFAQFLSSQAVLDTFMRITGSTDLVFADCQATRYRTGDFLTPHNDEFEGMNRRFAYVLSLTDGWLPRWGGLLHFVDDKGGVGETITPRFNALSLFAIGQSHYVSQVATYAPIPRISLTGWLRTKVPD